MTDFASKDEPKVHPATREILPDDPMEMHGFQVPGDPELMLRLLVEEYARIGCLLVCNACPPYEMEYLHSKFDFQRSNTLADVSGFYRAFGLTPGDEHPERPDHVVLELEFMAQLVGLQRRAAQGSDADAAEKADVCRDAQRRFLQEHLAWWTPAFARLLSKENPDGFLRGGRRVLGGARSRRARTAGRRRVHAQRRTAHARTS